MLYVLPFLTWLAAITSAVLLTILLEMRELKRYSAAVHLGWFAVAGYCQFFGPTMLVSALGLALQTVLAVLLLVRWKVSG